MSFFLLSWCSSFDVLLKTDMTHQDVDTKPLSTERYADLKLGVLPARRVLQPVGRKGQGYFVQTPTGLSEVSRGLGAVNAL